MGHKNLIKCFDILSQFLLYSFSQKEFINMSVYKLCCFFGGVGGLLSLSSEWVLLCAANLKFLPIDELFSSDK